ncbi:hypothetical protein [Candidatus Symbiopectobacterium sp.]|uniref:hypothetical protein n=1 Tax=Candidatus Symbiopectobacterium sp. TaxID=2816440 RepID=UPI0025C2DA11|nr:hypothetical protein [Candidatus Symbiopectobacterium sp.]
MVICSDDYPKVLFIQQSHISSKKSCLRMLLSPPRKTGLICCGRRDRAVLLKILT